MPAQRPQVYMHSGAHISEICGHSDTPRLDPNHINRATVKARARGEWRAFFFFFLFGLASLRFDLFIDAREASRRRIFIHIDRMKEKQPQRTA